MKNEIRYGRLKYFSFIILDLACVILANMLAVWIYRKYGLQRYRYKDHQSIITFMLVIDVVVTLAFNTLKRVLRRRKRKEIVESVKHVAVSFALLALALFTTKQGAEYSRITVYLAYGIYFVFIVAMRILWKGFLKLCRRKRGHPSAMLMTTDRFAAEGLEEMQKRDVRVDCFFLLKNIKCDEVCGVRVARDVEDAAAILCWDWVDKVYIYGLDHQMIPDKLIAACRQMGIQIDTVDFNYRIIEVKTVQNEDPKYGSLSFLEGKRDIPFPIRRVYWITETEASLHRGFHAHKQNCQLLFCPHGKIDILLDDGEEKTTVTLEGPEKGLLLMPGMWREMVWRETGSVLCVLASEYYDPEEYIRNYDEFIAYKEKNKSEAEK